MNQKHPLSLLSSGKLLVSPSVLAADFADLGHEIHKIQEAGADMVHLDVMDAHFVPNLSIGPGLIACLRKHTELPFDVHLMMTDPLNYIEAFSKAGADHITFHVECSSDIQKTIQAIHSCGCSAGITLKPGTSVETLLPWLPQIELVLVMTVEPGFGGQSFMPEQLKKVEFLHHYFKQQTSAFHRPHIQVDGGLGEENVRQAARAGANCIVAGTSVFRSPHGTATAVEILHAAQDELAR